MSKEDAISGPINPPGKDRYTIVVNTKKQSVTEQKQSYDEIVSLAFPNHDPNTVYGVAFTGAEEPKQGRLVKGQSVRVKNGTQFDVTATTKS